ncbi:unnamed protein product [Dovyalis caffra]|uniref:Uncharacterized protein n=1 Tax=Dovyalis caffra TaxID=77055 RepID=A0AAV1S6R7_9ROSI|nr:unnamed protein product [Dovyalis caffra]
MACPCTCNRGCSYRVVGRKHQSRLLTRLGSRFNCSYLHITVTATTTKLLTRRRGPSASMVPSYELTAKQSVQSFANWYEVLRALAIADIHLVYTS